MAVETGWRDQVSVVVEATPGTPVAATASDVARVIEAPRIYQPIESLISQERLFALSVDELIQEAASPGEFQFKTYLKGSGTPGTPIQAAYRAMLKGTYGRETVTGGVSVVYTHLRIAQDTRLTYTIMKKFATGMVLMGAGALFNMMDIAVRKRGNESILQATFSGSFMRIYWGGVATAAAGGSTTTVVLQTGQAKFFSAGMFITVGVLTPNPVSITSINYATDTLTVPTLSGTPGVGNAVTGWFPTAAADTGLKISGWRGVGTLGGTNFPHREIDYHIDNKIALVDDERNGTPYITDFVEGEDKREVTLRANHYFKPTDVGGMAAFYDANQEIKRALVIPVGDVAGRIYTIGAPIAQQVTMPDEDTSGRVTINRQYRLLASATGDDESTLTLT